MNALVNNSVKLTSILDSFRSVQHTNIKKRTKREREREGERETDLRICNIKP